MEFKSLYLLLNIATIFFPLLLSFDKKVQFYKKFKYLFPAIILVAVAFIIWDVWFTRLGVWSFNPDYLIGVYIAGLPLEECLFFITIPYACVFIYESLKCWFSWRIRPMLIHIWLFLTSIVLMALSIYYVNYLYTGITFFVLGLVLLLHHKLFKTGVLNYFLPAFAISVVPFFIINGVLTAKPVVIYNALEFMGYRMFTIPVEDLFYGFLLLLLNVSVFEWLRNGFQLKKIIQ